jgi:endonuclease III
VTRTKKAAGTSTVKDEITVTEGGKQRAKPKRVVKTKVSAGQAIPHPAPDNWEEVYDMIKAMRKREIAPVDTMGCQIAGKGEKEPKAFISPLPFCRSY